MRPILRSVQSSGKLETDASDSGSVMAIRVVLGFKAHTGWAAVVVLAEPSASPTVVSTRRIQLAKSTDLDRTQVYHSASKLWWTTRPTKWANKPGRPSLS